MGAASSTDGKAIFTSAGCASCHTLKAAGATGTVGPNLDQSKIDEAGAIQQVENGGGVMPAFKDSALRRADQGRRALRRDRRAARRPRGASAADFFALGRQVDHDVRDRRREALARRVDDAALEPVRAALGMRRDDDLVGAEGA